MTLHRHLSRRAFVAGSAGLAAAAALTPFPKVTQPVRASAQDAPPRASQQVLRWGGDTPLTRLGVHRYGGFLSRISPILYLPPFQSDATGNVLPGLCVDYTVSDNGLTYTFVLDPDAKFSDGSKVTAADVKFTWEYVANPASGNPWQYYQTAAVLGHEAVFKGEAIEMEGLVVVDDETLEIRLARPFSPFLKYCTQCLNGIHQKKNIVDGGEDWDLVPTVSCGPYVIERFDVTTGEATFVPNPHWWRDTPAISQIEYRVAPDVNTLSVLFSNDEIDIQHVPINLAAQIVNSDLRDLIVETPCPGLFVMPLRTTVALMDDVNVRRALLLASDVQSVVSAIFRGAFEPATTFSHPIIPGDVEREPLYSPDAAQEALAASSYRSAANLPPIVCSVAPASPYRQAVEAFQQVWQEVLGVEPAILPTEPGFDPNEIGANVFTGGPAPLFIDAGGFISWAFKPDNIYFRNTIQTEDAALNALVEQAEALPVDDVEGRSALYQQAEEVLFDQAYMIPYANNKSAFLVKPWVANASFRPDISPDIVPMYIAER